VNNKLVFLTEMSSTEDEDVEMSERVIYLHFLKQF